MLEEVYATARWGLLKAELSKFVMRKTGGRPSYDLLLWYKMSFLKVWHGLSHEKTEGNYHFIARRGVIYHLHT
jgi:hypothetical protein